MVKKAKKPQNPPPPAGGGGVGFYCVLAYCGTYQIGVINNCQLTINN